MRSEFLVSGRVQGVGFRHFTRRTGLRIGVTGWVANRMDGRVEAVAEGRVDQLDEFERALRMGPPGSSVTDIHRTDNSDEPWPAIGFEIR